MIFLTSLSVTKFRVEIIYILTINVPADYVLAMKKARRNPEPYSMNYVDHKFFKNYEKSISYFKSIRPGKMVGDPCVHDLRALKYTSQGVQYKLRFNNEWQDLPIRSISAAKPTDISCISSLYSERLKIQKRKYDDLQSLKSTIPADYHHFMTVCLGPCKIEQCVLLTCLITSSFISLYIFYVPWSIVVF